MEKNNKGKKESNSQRSTLERRVRLQTYRNGRVYKQAQDALKKSEENRHI